MADRRGQHAEAPAAREEDQDTMTLDLSVEVPAAPRLRLDVLAEFGQLRARVRSAENRAAKLARAGLRSADRQRGGHPDLLAHDGELGPADTTYPKPPQHPSDLPLAPRSCRVGPIA
jgi:hypothetical protein